MNPLFIGGIVAIAISWMLTAFLWNQNTGLTEQLVEANRAVIERDAKITKLEQQRETDQKNITVLGVAVNEAQTAKDKEIAKLNSYRERLSKAATGRPALVGRLATRATGRVMCSFNAASGGNNGCQTVPSAPAGTN